MKRVLLASAIALVASVASAQDAPALPDPATIQIPNISATDSKVIEEGYKFFFFHNPSVSFAEAHADIAECRSFLAAGEFRLLPSFVPWVEPVKRKVEPRVPAYGLVGAAIGAIVVPKLERGIRNNKVRRCMEPRGYARYPLPEASWDKLNDGDEAALIAMQAKLASGPKPNQPEVLEKCEDC